MRIQTALRYSACLLLSMAAFACGGDKGSNPNDPPVNSQTPGERAASLEEVRVLVNTIIPDAFHPPEDGDTRLATAIAARPEFAEATAVPGGVWAKFRDGEELFVFNNRKVNDEPEGSEGPDSAAYVDDPVAAPTSPRAIGALGDLAPAGRPPGLTPSTTVPTSKKARLINTMGTAFVNSIPVIKPWLENAGYEVNVSGGSVEDLANVTGDGVIYFGGHGLPDKHNPAGHCALWTTTLADSATLLHYRAELASGLLAYGVGEVDRNPAPIGGVSLPTRERHMVITEKFIRAHWRPAAGALIYLDTCYGLDPRLFITLLDPPVSAEAVVGWTDKAMDDMAVGSTRFFFDRMLGANSYGPYRNPPQRPFDATSVITAMGEVRRKNLIPFDTSVWMIGSVPVPGVQEAKLQLRLRPDGTTSILRPGIANARIAEITPNGWLELNGTFGAQPGTVTFNGQPLAVQPGGWTAGTIRCNRPPDSGGFTGDLAVNVGGHISNPRRITGWDLTCNVHWQEFDTSVCPACQWDATWQGKLRADADRVRVRPETRPRGGVITSSATTDQHLTIDEASGTYRIRLDVSYDVFWSTRNPGNVPAIGVCLGYLPQETYIGLCFALDTVQHRITLQPAFEAKGVNAFYVPVVPGEGTYAGSQPAYSNYLGTSPNRGGTATVDGSSSIVGGQHTVGIGQSVLRWQTAAAINPPSPTMPK